VNISKCTILIQNNHKTTIGRKDGGGDPCGECADPK
jgi:hypothetical protein